MQDVMKRQRQARRTIIRRWRALPRDKRTSMDQIAAYAKLAVLQNADAFAHSHRHPYQKVMAWLLPRAGHAADALRLPSSGLDCTISQDS